MTSAAPARRSLRERVAALGPVGFVLYAGLTSFGVYSCMYGFRKGFTAGSYDDIRYFGVSLKVLMLASQTLGYMVSKIYGIRFIGELKRTGRHKVIIGLVLAAWVSLLLFGLTPPPYNVVFMFFNGLPLGLVWGVVFSYLEGRRTSELLGAMLSVSLIFSAGLVRTVGKETMLIFGSASWWMPFVTGGIFVVPVIVCTLLLENIPPPTEADVRERRQRVPMDGRARASFFRAFARALAPALVAYVMISILRDVRDNFSNEIWHETGYGERPLIFTSTEAVVAVAVLAIVGPLFLVRDNLKAFRISHALIASGFIVGAIGTYLLRAGHIGVIPWMIVTGIALYVPYLAFTCVYYERMIATSRVDGNVGFMLYAADSFGYLGAIGALIWKECTTPRSDWVSFLGAAYYGCGILGPVMLATACAGFENIRRKRIAAGEHVAPDAPHREPKPYPDAI